jgi:hypothetical protein
MEREGRWCFVDISCPQFYRGKNRPGVGSGSRSPPEPPLFKFGGHLLVTCPDVLRGKAAINDISEESQGTSPCLFRTHPMAAAVGHKLRIYTP